MLGLVKFEVWASWGVVCANLRSVRWVRIFMICQCLTFFAPHFGVSAWRLKCPNSDVQWKIYLRTDNRWAKEIRWEGMSQVVVNLGKHVFYIGQWIEWVVEQLLATEEGLFSMTLIIIHCNDFDSYNEGNLQSNYSIISSDEIAYYSLTWQRSH